MSAHDSERDELIEQAQLHVLGLLEEAERIRFERCLEAADAETRQTVIQFQAELAREQLCLPAVEPEPSLKFRVLAEVAEAVQDRDAAFAPIASIGPASAELVANQVSADHEGFSEVGRSNWEFRREAARWRRSSAMWRAASLVFAGGIGASLLFYAALSREYQTLAARAFSSGVEREITAKSTGLESALTWRPVVHSLSACGGFTGAGFVVADSVHNRIIPVVVADGADQLLTVSAVGEDGVRVTLGSFRVGTGIASAELAARGLQVRQLRDFELADEHGLVVLRWADTGQVG